MTRPAKFCQRDIIVCQAFTLCLTEEDFHRVLTEANVPVEEWGEFVAKDASGRAHTFPETDKHTRFTVICMKGWEGKDPLVVAGLLVHEAVHLFQRFCNFIGEDDPSSEFEAYSIQWIAQELMEEFVRQTHPETN